MSALVSDLIETPALPRFASIGECMVEFSQTADGGWRRGFAGDTFNTAWYFRHLTADRWTTQYVTCVGADRTSQALKDFIASFGIDISAVRTIEERRPGLYTIELDGAERSFSYWRELSAAKLVADDPEWLMDVLAPVREIYFSGITLAILPGITRVALIRILERMKFAGIRINFDPNIRLALWDEIDECREWLEQAAAVSTRVFPTYGDDKLVFGDVSPTVTAERYANWGVEEVVVKDGDLPCIAIAHDERCEVAAVPVAHPVDTTGAGDSFNAGYLAARVDGQSVAQSCAAGHALAASVICQRGALLQPPPARLDILPGN